MAERIERLSAPNELGCWVWRSKVVNGYGRIEVRSGVGRTSRTTEAAHRVSYETFVGPIPDGLQIDHLCRNRLCVNPVHLEPVTGRVNTLRGNTITAANFAKTECKSDHPLAGANLKVLPSGERRCRTCERAAKRRYRAAHSERLRAEARIRMRASRAAS
jgi:hypothetical protein